MKFTVDSQLLAAALKFNSAFIEDLGTHNCVFSSSEEKDSILIQSSSKTCWVKSIVPAKVAVEGQFSTEAKVLSMLKLTGKEIAFELVKDKLQIKSGRTKGALDTLQADPKTVSPPNRIALTHKFRLEPFKEIVKAMDFDSDVIEKLDSRPVRLKCEGTKLWCSTNDRYCMGLASAEQDKEMEAFEAILPLELLTKILAHLTQDFRMGVSQDAIRIKCKAFDLTHAFVQSESELADAAVVLKKARKIVPQSVATFDSTNFIDVLKEVTSFDSEKTKESKVTISCLVSQTGGTIALEADHGKLNSFVEFQDLTSDTEFKVSAYLLKELLGSTIGQVTLSVYPNKILMQDQHRTYLMPVMA